MTTCYQYFGFPEEFSVVCPKCDRESHCSNPPIATVNEFGNIIVHRNRIDFKRDVSCLNCGFAGKVTINWPRDAYWKCEVKGKTLWTWSLEHTKVLLDYIQSPQRNEKAYPGQLAALWHLPTHFKLAKNREVAIKSLRKLIMVNS